MQRWIADFCSAGLRCALPALAGSSVLPSLLLSAVALPLRGLHRAVAVLSAMPGVDMYFAGPLALLNFLHLSAQQGILIKDGRSLELLHTVDTVVFDKTGTLTLEEPEVAQIHPFVDFHEDDVLRFAAIAEAHQSHPIAQAILTAAQARNLTLPDGVEARYEIGYGVQVHLRQTKVMISPRAILLPGSEIVIDTFPIRVLFR